MTLYPIEPFLIRHPARNRLPRDLPSQMCLPTSDQQTQTMEI